MKTLKNLFLTLFVLILSVNFAFAVEISGSAVYSDNNAPVLSGTVKLYTLNGVLVRTATVQNGLYLMTDVPYSNEERDVIICANNELDGFVPTYSPNVIDWQTAQKVIPITNLTNVNLFVTRVSGGGGNPMTSSVSGTVLMGNQPVKDAIIYAQSEGSYKNYEITGSDGQFNMNLPLGDYILVVHRIGMSSAKKIVTLTEEGLGNINFGLEVVKLAELKNSISTAKDFKLSQNYPNPFNPSTKIQYALSNSGNVKVNVYNSAGQVVKELVNEFQNSGSHVVEFDGKNLSSGIYYYKLESNGFSDTRKMILVK